MNAPDNRRSRESFPENRGCQTETSDTDSVLLWANVLLTQCHDSAILEEMGFFVNYERSMVSSILYNVCRFSNPFWAFRLFLECRGKIPYKLILEIVLR